MNFRNRKHFLFLSVVALVLVFFTGCFHFAPEDPFVFALKVVPSDEVTLNFGETKEFTVVPIDIAYNELDVAGVLDDPFWRLQSKTDDSLGSLSAVQGYTVTFTAAEADEEIERLEGKIFISMVNERNVEITAYVKLTIESEDTPEE